MQLTSVETTPNPNSMKFNVDVDLGPALTYSGEHLTNSPAFVKSLLAIAGVKSAFVCHNFITLNKDPRVDWHNIVSEATKTFAGEGAAERSSEKDFEKTRETAARDGQAHVQVQTFRGVPIQVKVEDSQSQKRISLGERFNDAAKTIQDTLGADFLKERYWADYGIRYGAPDSVAEEVAQEINSLFSDVRLKHMVDAALGNGVQTDDSIQSPTADWQQSNYWQERLAAIQYFSQTPNAVPSLILGLSDQNAQVRRLAAAALGATGSSDAVGALTRTVLDDDHVGVRRTAADALSDIGDVSAEPAMCIALKDKNKLVRWRAARFLFDLGTENALPDLERAANDSEFEVRLEIEAAIQRIKGKGAGIGPAWKRIIEAPTD